MEAERLMRHMPKYYRVIAEIIILQKAIETELEEIDLMSQDVLNQFFIYTATWSLPIWERIFGIPIGDETSNLEERRELLISKLRGYGTTTKEMIIRVGNAFTNGGVKIIEHNDKYTFDVVFSNVIGIPKNMENFRKTIEIIKPAHLGYKIVFLYRRHNQLKKFTHGELKAYTHKQIFSDNSILGGVN